MNTQVSAYSATSISAKASHLAQAAVGPEPDGEAEQRRRQQAPRGQGHVVQVEPVEAPDVAEALGEAPGLDDGSRHRSSSSGRVRVFRHRREDERAGRR
jgi:hypothetical protein